mmetsp:Transcript_13545/g.41790  ORF Transcript_13545/g.41790 Transcript_13545/m.41790 type:complete len:382 (+) Transcript_13545:36-1181(+)
MAAVAAPWQPQPPWTGAPMVPQRLPQGMPPGAPLIPEMSFPPQRLMDSAPEDGPVSVAYKAQPEVVKIEQLRPCPDTRQYLHRGYSRFQERALAQPSQANDICGWVLATIHTSDHAEANRLDEEIMHVRHNDFRLVFQCISGWALMNWASQDAFEEGIHGARRAPRPLAWWDLRKAWDVKVDVGDPFTDIIAHRITVSTSSGNLYFCVELAENVPIWYSAIRGLIKDNAVHQVKARDTVSHQRKRWPAACGLASALAAGGGIGDRALAIAFHAYDMDCDCALQVGELMVLVTELIAGLLHVEGRAEGHDRETAVYTVGARIHEEDMFERAARFRRRCDAAGDGRVRKDDFIRFGQGAMLEAIEMAGIPGGMDYAGGEPFWG